MPLFVCDRCLSIENTGATEPAGFCCRGDDPARCSECLTGKWHGRFPKRPATVEELNRRRDEFQTTAGFDRVFALASLVKALRSCRYTFNDEAQLQAGVAQVLELAGYRFEREVTLSPAVRLDLFDASSGFAIECKIKGTPSALARQVLGYLERPEVNVVIVVCRPGLGRYIARCDHGRIAVVDVGGLL